MTSKATEALAKLHDDGGIFWFYINMNDVWAWACADAARIDCDEWEDHLAELYLEHGYNVLIAWVSLREDEPNQPQKPLLEQIGQERWDELVAICKKKKEEQST